MKKNKKKNTKSKKNGKITNFFGKLFKNSDVKFSITETIIFMFVVFGLGLIIGGIIMYSRGTFKGSRTSLNEFTATYNELVDNYYQEVDKDKLLEAGISGMINYLGDPYSTYLTKENAEDFNEDVEGTYQGIGAEIRYNDANEPCIGRVFEDSPAEKAGLMENDVILKASEIDVVDKTLSEIADIIKGEKGTDVNVTIRRDGEEKVFTLTRAVVDNISVTSEVIESNGKKIGYLYISVFAANTTKQFKTELNKLEKENINSLIIDVRGNSGGYLNTVTDIISLFTKKDAPIYQLKTKDKVEVVYDKTDESRDYTIVVLADRNSASASEVLTGALKETYHAQVVGTKTFGKGRVQKVLTLSSGALFKYTYQEWLTPDGNYIDKEGISPDIEIEYDNTNGEDNQKEKAIELLSN